MTTSIFVWYLIVSISNSNGIVVNQLGPYSDQASCERTSGLPVLGRYYKQCVQVAIPILTRLN